MPSGSSGFLLVPKKQINQIKDRRVDTFSAVSQGGKSRPLDRAVLRSNLPVRFGTSDARCTPHQAIHPLATFFFTTDAIYVSWEKKRRHLYIPRLRTNFGTLTLDQDRMVLSCLSRVDPDRLLDINKKGRRKKRKEGKRKKPRIKSHVIRLRVSTSSSSFST
ncbi:hypothetical protein VTN77DRAFT_1137 [Rasamsonia byssochlamydoides]|uniref:uncharacterized protein n=1 Tax=Rasamsonia byssochlamydoides TaxID=89139 RepID=UPI0037424350